MVPGRGVAVGPPWVQGSAVQSLIWILRVSLFTLKFQFALSTLVWPDDPDFLIVLGLRN